MIGRTLAHYRILDMIGRGGMGVVYRAKDERLDRDIALKVLPSGALADDASRKRFQREALALSRLSHPNIETVHDFDSRDGIDFLVMEYIPGVSLDQRLAAGALAENEVLALGAQLAQGLVEAHARGVVHGDLKPANLRITPDHRLKILDFGLAQLLRPVTEEAPTETLVSGRVLAGTPPYMAPEQFKGARSDARVDLYMAGAVLYEMATGRRAFPQANGEALVEAILHEAPRSPRALNPAISRGLEDIILKALAKEPQRRYQSAADLCTDLQSHAAVPARSEPRWRFARPARPMLAAGTVALVALAGFIGYRYFWTGGPPDSLAVLPFENAGGNPEAEYLSDGVTESIINTISTLPRVKVIARASVFRYKGKEIDPRMVGRQLGVSAVLVGRVLRRGRDVVVSVELVDARDRRHLWGDQYTRRLSDILLVQGEIADHISLNLRPRLTGEEKKRLATRSAGIPEAYEHYLKGRFALNKGTKDDCMKAVEHFKSAVAIDPAYALGYAGLADAYYGVSNLYVPPREAMPKARAAALRALELDETLGEAHASLGLVKAQYDWDWPGAGEEFRRAIDLNPGYAAVHQWYALYLAELGELDEAVAEMVKARALDPLSVLIGGNVALLQYLAGRLDEAEDEIHKTLELDPEAPAARLFLGLVRSAQGNISEGIVKAEKAYAMDEASEYAGWLGYLYVRSGRRGDAERLVRDLEKRANESARAHSVAMIHASLGNKDEAFAWLDRAYENHDEGIGWIRVDPRLQPLRSDPRYADLLRRIGLSLGQEG